MWSAPTSATIQEYPSLDGPAYDLTTANRCSMSMRFKLTDFLVHLDTRLAVIVQSSGPIDR